MEYLYAFLIFLGLWFFTTWSAVIFGEFLAGGYIALAVMFGLNYPIFGIAGLAASVLNIFIASKYINSVGAVSKAPANGIIASRWYVLTFLVIILLKYGFSISNDTYETWYFYAGAIGFWILIDTLTSKKGKKQTSEEYFESVTAFQIVEKYDNDPKWATLLHFDDGREDWNRTIKGSFRAKHPSEDLTFVFDTQEEAIRYAEQCFINAELIKKLTFAHEATDFPSHTITIFRACASTSFGDSNNHPKISIGIKCE